MRPDSAETANGLQTEQGKRVVAHGCGRMKVRRPRLLISRWGKKGIRHFATRAQPCSRPTGSTPLVLEPDLNRLDDAVKWHV
jgi:hypothetical protein